MQKLVRPENLPEHFVGKQESEGGGVHRAGRLNNTVWKLMIHSMENTQTASLESSRSLETRWLTDGTGPQADSGALGRQREVELMRLLCASRCPYRPATI